MVLTTDCFEIRHSLNGFLLSKCNGCGVQKHLTKRLVRIGWCFITLLWAEALCPEIGIPIHVVNGSPFESCHCSSTAQL